MNRALKILSVAVILFLAYMWVSILYKSCNKNTEFDDFQDDIVQTDTEVPSLTDDYEGEPFFEDEEEEGDDLNEPVKEDPIDYNELDQKIENTQKETPVVKPQTTTANRNVDSGSSTGKYMIMAGSYILESNADEMVKKLNKLGYDNAEKVVFDLSQFHSVCAGRFDDYTKAVQTSAELKRRGVDNYVHRRK